MIACNNGTVSFTGKEFEVLADFSAIVSVMSVSLGISRGTIYSAVELGLMNEDELAQKLDKEVGITIHQGKKGSGE